MVLQKPVTLSRSREAGKARDRKRDNEADTHNNKKKKTKRAWKSTGEKNRISSTVQKKRIPSKLQTTTYVSKGFQTFPNTSMVFLYHRKISIVWHWTKPRKLDYQSFSRRFFNLFVHYGRGPVSPLSLTNPVTNAFPTDTLAISTACRFFSGIISEGKQD